MFFGRAEMNEKLQESAQHLKCFSNLEIEAFRVYEAMSKKINQPESSFILGLAYDSFKCSKILQGILSHLDLSEIENTECKKEITELAAEISRFTKIVSSINNLSPLLSCEILSELINMEDLLNETYANYLQSSATKFVADEFSTLIPQSSNNFKRIFECFVQEKEEHRQTLIEVIYNLESKEAERVRHVSPVVKYQNPDAWYHESTIHAFTRIPLRAKNQP
jgi:rubrerythrin